MRSSAEIEDDDNVVHDETSPKNQKTIPEAEFTEITNGPLPEKQNIEVKKPATFKEEAIPLIEWIPSLSKF
jgi:hypothetical protein